MSSEDKDHELFFGLVCPVGTNKQLVIDALEKALRRVDYKIEKIRFTDLLQEIDGFTMNLDRSLPENERITNFMNAGNDLRCKVTDGGALAKLAMIEINDKRATKYNDETGRTAYILDSLKHPDEVQILQHVYGKNFWLISAHSPKDDRLTRLIDRIKQTSHGKSTEECTAIANELIKRDQKEEDDFGQQIGKTFHLGDVFVDTLDDDLDKSIERFVDLIFNAIDPTPDMDEYGMFYAKASAFRSGSLARQVGAVILSEIGDVLATGTNEVPSYGGGLCGPDHHPEQRESSHEYDSNTHQTIELLHDFVSRLKEEGWFNDEKSNKNVDELVKKITSIKKLKNSRLMDVTEYGREVHAEMAALMNAARQTISVSDCILYCTTFPCHVCTKHIIASGINEVIYIEPYPKSLAEDLFGVQDGLITVDKKSEGDKVAFHPFVGISPTRFMDLFAWKEKKTDDGKKIIWNPKISKPRYWDEPIQIQQKEKIFANKIAQKILTTPLRLTK